MASVPALPEVRLRDGRLVAVRPLRPTDAVALASFFAGLAARTRGYYGPHPFDEQTAQRLCAEIDPSRAIRFVGVVGEGGATEIVGYMIVQREIGRGDLERYARHGPPLRADVAASFAPCIADAYQEQGLGTAMARHVLAAARETGIRQLILMGGVQTRNERGRRMYERLGFRVVGSFDVVRDGQTLGNLDMICEP